jgi:BlaI family transcriptional regulator, penicillinase repressor
MKRSTRRPTRAELQILRVLWTRGPCTVREIARALGREDSYTTVLKQLQIMTERRFVWRDESARSHVYAARTAARAAESQVVRDLLDRVFGGSAVKLMMCALEIGSVSQQELAELRKLVAVLPSSTSSGKADKADLKVRTTPVRRS